MDLGDAYTVGTCAIRAGERQLQALFTLAVSRKALYQPQLKFRRWLETLKPQDIPVPAVAAIGTNVAAIESKLPSLDTDSTLGPQWRTRQARSLDYLVVGINEYYTSKRCPNCKREGKESDDFVGIAR
ncbi:hypothetical protein BGZ65_005820 [Modicella reniformis]|uniref:Transposase n=1 Tax=Modicella reniformis TaxID=1440133 RepID=A0A9P6LYM1_9FUNG|nr:hypothetical protein BGZ65_005820 [Modicella reniformis]